LKEIDAYHIDMYLYELLIEYFNIFQSKLINEDLNKNYKDMKLDDLITEFNYYNQSIYKNYSRYIMRIRELYKCLLLLQNIDEDIIKLIKEFFDKIKDSEIAMDITEYLLKKIYIKYEENITVKYKSMLKYDKYEIFIKNIDKILESQKPRSNSQKDLEQIEIVI
jgi:hypothetical protein